MTSIARIEYSTAAIPLETPIAFATAGVSVRCFGLLRIHAADGATGLAYGYLGNRPTSLVWRAIRELLAPVLVGRDSTEVAARWEEMFAATALHGRAGAVMRAIALVDIALHDLNARRAGLPLYRHLGGEPKETVPAYAAGGYYVEGKEAPALATEMADLVALGFDAVKMKTGKYAPHVEAQRVGAVRAAIGGNVRLMLDANSSWPDVASALAYLRLVEPHQPYWIEEPFAPDDLDSHARLARACAIPVALGENEASRWRFRDMLARKAAAFVQPDATACGGITEWMRIDTIAAGYRTPVCPHAYHDLHVHLLAASASPGLIEFMPGHDIMNFGRLIDRGLAHCRGAILLPTRPGLGFDFVDAAVERYAVREAGEAHPWLRVS
jgi:L-alanine-DL-glutamate epimerase-like enolase superfamily enzyme